VTDGQRAGWAARGLNVISKEIAWLIVGMIAVLVFLIVSRRIRNE